jgi:WD40 repeat protein
MSHPAWVWTIRFSPDGRQLLTACFDGTARLWDVATGQPQGEPLRHDDMVNIAVFSPDGRTVATGGRDRAARLWDAATGLQIGPTLPHADAVYSVAFHPDGSLLATTGPDRAVHFWRVPRAAEGTTLQLRSDIEKLSSRRLSTSP